MKKYSILLFLALFLISGCSISSYLSDLEDYFYGEAPPPEEEDTEDTEGTENTENDENEEPSTENTNIEDILGKPYIPSRININENAYFYPNSLSAEDSIIQEYTYVYEQKATKYKIYSAYYSVYYDTVYIAYDTVKNGTQTLKAKDLYEIERHALNYFITDNNKTDYKNYLKAVLIYPDTVSSSCRKGITNDNSTININGCANYVGKEAVISLNRLSSLDEFYNERIDSVNMLQINAMRYTYAHEFGHVSTFYNMAYKNDENYEDYLKIRLNGLYQSIYPNGLPSTYSSQDNSYYIQPTEILADDYVELFYNTSQKVAEDTYEYTLDQEYTRNSLKNYATIHSLRDNKNLFDNIRNYYITNFLDYSKKTEYKKPIVVSSNLSAIEYYESYSKIGKNNALKSIVSKLNGINLIAVGEVEVNGIKYYRVILSNTFNTTNNSYDEKSVGEKMGYVKASLYTTNNTIKIYEINYYKRENTMLGKNSMAPIQVYTNIYILPYYDFSYVLSLDGNTNEATTYDYLNTNIQGQKYKISVYSFGTLVN